MSYNKDKVPYISFVDSKDVDSEDDAAAAGVAGVAGVASAATAHGYSDDDDEELENDDAELIAEINAEREAARARLSVGAEGTVMRLPERRSLMKSLSPSPVEKRLMQGINPRTVEGWRNRNRRREGLFTYEREPTTSPAMMTKLLGRNHLARELMVNLALDLRRVRRAPMTQKVRQMVDRIERRVNGPKVREAGLPRITMNELHAYAVGTLFNPRSRFQPLPQYMPPQFPTVVQPLQPFTEASCLTTKKQLQQQRDELIKILKEKHAMLFNLQRIHFASIDDTNLDHATRWDADEGRGGEQGMRHRRWEDHLEIAEKKSREAITTLTEQCGQLRDRINELTEEITRKSRGMACSLLGGGKTKSKYTKSKKSKRRNRKYSKRK